MKKLLLTLLLFSAGTGISAAKTYDLKSPDGKIAVRVDVSADAVTYSISRDGKELIAPSPLSLTLADGRVLGRKASVRKASAKSVDEIIEAPFYKRSAVEDRYNSLTLTFKGDYGIDFRAYDDGAAYRFRTSMKDEITVTDELVDIRFPEDFTTLVPYARDGKKEPGLARYYFNSFENTYSTQPVSKVADDRLAFGARGGYRFGGKLRSDFSLDDEEVGLRRYLFGELFPLLKDARISHTWGGNLGMARRFRPHMLLDRASGIALSGGYGGEGVGASNLGGRTLAALILGEDSELLRQPWVLGERPLESLARWEPEPCRWLGYNAIIRSFVHEDRVLADPHSAPWRRSLAQTLAAGMESLMR